MRTGAAEGTIMGKTKRIAFQGELGANSHLAIAEAYPDSEAVPCATFEDAFALITAGEADLGMIPVENSLAGRVADIHHLMPDSGLHIVAEHFMPVRHQLLGIKGARLADIKTVESHVHALGQCRQKAAGPPRYRRLGPRYRASRRQDARRHRVAARRRDLRARHPGGGRRG